MDFVTYFDALAPASSHFMSSALSIGVLMLLSFAVADGTGHSVDWSSAITDLADPTSYPLPEEEAATSPSSSSGQQKQDVVEHEERPHTPTPDQKKRASTPTPPDVPAQSTSMLDSSLVIVDQPSFIHVHPSPSTSDPSPPPPPPPQPSTKPEPLDASAIIVERGEPISDVAAAPTAPAVEGLDASAVLVPSSHATPALASDFDTDVTRTPTPLSIVHEEEAHDEPAAATEIAPETISSKGVTSARGYIVSSPAQDNDDESSKSHDTDDKQSGYIVTPPVYEHGSLSASAYPHNVLSSSLYPASTAPAPASPRPGMGVLTSPISSGSQHRRTNMTARDPHSEAHFLLHDPEFDTRAMYGSGTATSAPVHQNRRLSTASSASSSSSASPPPSYGRKTELVSFPSPSDGGKGQKGGNSPPSSPERSKSFLRKHIVDPIRDATRERKLSRERRHSLHKSDVSALSTPQNSLDVQQPQPVGGKFRSIRRSVSGRLGMDDNSGVGAMPLSRK